MSSKKNNNNNRSFLQWIIPTIILVVCILFILVNYSSSVLKRETEAIVENYENKVREISDYYSSEVYMVGHITRMLSSRVSAKFDYFCDENVNLLRSAVKQLELDAAYIMNKKGEVMTDKGVEYKDLSRTAGDVAVEENDYGSRYVVTSYGDCLHFVCSDFAEGTVILKCSPKKLSNLETVGKSSSKVCTYMLVSSEGIIIDSVGQYSKEYKAGEDLFSFLKDATYEKSIKENVFRGYLAEQREEQILAYMPDGVNKYFIFKPIGDSTTNYRALVMVMIDEEQVNDAANAAISQTRTMVMEIFILIAIFLVALVIISIISAAKYTKANRELREQAETDLLTDLYNKIATETKIKDYLATEGNNMKSLMFVLDIDNFKKINDTMGHAFGDEVLSTLGHQLKSEFRVNDIIGRTGGDEFIIFLKDLKDDAVLKKEAQRVAEFFKNFKVGEYTKYSATASIGAVEIPEDGTDFETLYKSADKALYKAKKRGKNQMAFYRELLDEEKESILSSSAILDREDNNRYVEPVTEVYVTKPSEEKPQVEVDKDLIAPIFDQPAEKLPDKSSREQANTPVKKKVRVIVKKDANGNIISRTKIDENGNPITSDKANDIPKKTVKKVVKKVVKKPIENNN